MDSQKKAFAAKLLDIKAIQLQPKEPLHGHRDGNHPFIATTGRRSHTPNCAVT